MTDSATVPDDDAPPKGNALAQAWLVLLLALLYGGGLAGVQSALSPRIAANQLNETLDQIPELVPGAASGIERSAELGDGAEDRLFQALDEDGHPCGWVVKSAGQGFADRIEVLIGLDREAATITGIYVLSQKETPGLGDYISTPAFTDRLRDLPADVELEAVRGGGSGPGEFEAWTGATVSSVAVSGIINTGLARVRPVLARLPTEASEAQP